MLNMKKNVLLLTSVAALSGCYAKGIDFPELQLSNLWRGGGDEAVLMSVDTAQLKAWWMHFNDPALNALVETAMEKSPDRLIAQSRVQEARGIYRSTRSTLFPQVGASGTDGRQKTAFGSAADYYDARFDASYEIDVFGKNRKATSAADKQILALEASYHDVSLTLAAEIARSYINYRAFQKQALIAKKNLELQEKTLELIKQQFEFGEAPQLDVERSENLVNVTRASIPDFERQAENSFLAMSVLVGEMPDRIARVVGAPAGIPMSSIQPILMSPADVIATRPDVRAASETLAANTDLAESVTAQLLPTFTISGLYGVTKNAVTSSTNVWDIAIGAAVSVLDFGRIEGLIDSQRAIERQAYESYRKTVLGAVVEVETALNDMAKIDEQRASLQKAYENADKAFTLSETLYREGEISFLDVLDAQRQVNEADSALISSEAAQAESHIRLYKSLGVY